MPQPSIFQQYIEQFMPMLGLYVSEKVNGKNERERTYLHKQRLIKVFSPDQKWENTSANTSLVMADYVAFDSPFPPKKRDQVRSANGVLPKIGVRRDLNETDINNINIMQAQLSRLQEGSDAYKQKKRQIIKNLADDASFCAIAIDERNEYAYLKGISEGIVVMQGDENDKESMNLGMRIDFGYKDENIFRTAKAFECESDDIQKVMDKVNADAGTIALAMVSKELLDKIRKTRWARELAADYKEQVYTDATKLPVPTVKSFTDAFENEYGFGFQIVDRTVIFQRDGKNYPIKPFNPNRIIFLPNSSTDGSLVYGELAEMTNPAEGVSYSTIEDYKLISRLRITEPSFAERTKGQAMVLPVIEDADKIYVLDFSKSVDVDSTDDTDTGAVDAKITIEDTAYQKAAVVAALNDLGDNIKASVTDATVIKHINALSDADYAKMMEAIKDKKYSAS